MRRLSRLCATSLHQPPCRHPHLSTTPTPLIHPTSTRHQSNNTSPPSTNKPSFPFAGYYADALDAPLHTISPLTLTSPTPPPPDDPPQTEKEKTLAKARIIFGSRLAGPAERRDEIRKLSQNIAGVMVPPKPEEPDNCCMSGCVNCVWDRYRDEIEEWAEASAEARRRVAEQRQRGSATGMMSKEKGMPSHVAVSMDDDGGGSETNWSEGDLGLGGEGEDVFAGIPVGIREFMKTEKRLKEQRKRVGKPAVND